MPRTALGSLSVIVALIAGCTNAPSGGGDPQTQVKTAFESLQAALKAKDADKIWGLIDKDSQADAERAAKAWKEEYAKADADKTKKDLGITADDLAKLDGKSFLKTEAFHAGKIDELVKGKFEKATVLGDSAVVNYIEPDQDKEKLNMTRQDGQWKANIPKSWMATPKK
jgi:hypothetical protein